MSPVVGLCGAGRRPAYTFKVFCWVCLLGCSACAFPACPTISVSCSCLQAAGITSNGIYTITTRNTGSTLPVRCDMTRAGGGWTKIFGHDYRNKTSGLAQRRQVDVHTGDPDALLYSILSLIQELKTAAGPFEFLMAWPNSVFPGLQIWRQTDLPAADGTPANFVSVNTPYQSRDFFGLHYSDHLQILMDGSASSWAFAIMQSREWNGGLYGPGAMVEQVELWIRDVVCHVDCATCIGPAAYECTSCTNPTFTLSSNGVCGDFTGLPTSCLEALRADPGLVSGFHTIHTINGAVLNVSCDMEAFGGGWTRLFHHDYRKKDVLATYKQVDANTHDPAAKLYSIMSLRDDFRLSNSSYEFYMEWPHSIFAGQRQHWRQADFSGVTGTPAGYTPLLIPQPGAGENVFIGLHLSERFQTTFDGSQDSWAFAVMQYKTWGGALFGPGMAVPEAALWIREYAMTARTESAVPSTPSPAPSIAPMVAMNILIGNQTSSSAVTSMPSVTITVGESTNTAVGSVINTHPNTISAETLLTTTTRTPITRSLSTALVSSMASRESEPIGADMSTSISPTTAVSIIVTLIFPVNFTLIDQVAFDSALRDTLSPGLVDSSTISRILYQEGSNSLALIDMNSALAAQIVNSAADSGQIRVKVGDQTYTAARLNPKPNEGGNNGNSARASIWALVGGGTMAVAILVLLLVWIISIRRAKDRGTYIIDEDGNADHFIFEAPQHLRSSRTLSDEASAMGEHKSSTESGSTAQLKTFQ